MSETWEKTEEEDTLEQLEAIEKLKAQMEEELRIEAEKAAAETVKAQAEAARLAEKKKREEEEAARLADELKKAEAMKAQLAAVEEQKRAEAAKVAAEFAEAKALLLQWDYDRAVPLLEKLAAAGHGEAMFALGDSYRCVGDRGAVVLSNQAQRDEWYKKAVSILQPLAAAGDPGAQTTLGRCYLSGHGVSKDRVRAVELFAKAAGQGWAEGQYFLGKYYGDGTGAEFSRDFDKAAEWFRKAAEQGNAEAQYELGFLYEIGAGVPKDKSKAKALITSAAEQGLVRAQDKLKELKYRLPF
jgi:TPR repeat protein